VPTTNLLASSDNIHASALFGVPAPVFPTLTGLLNPPVIGLYIARLILVLPKAMLPDSLILTTADPTLNDGSLI
jgi:hypothetical protein